MLKEIKIEIPYKLIVSLKISEDEIANEFKKLALLKLYELGKISSSLASQILNIERVEFLELLSQYNISYFAIDTKEQLEKDIKNA